MTVDNDSNNPSSFIQSLAKQRQEYTPFQNKLSDILNYCSNLQSSDLPPLYAMQKIGSDSEYHFKKAMEVLFTDLYTRFYLQQDYTIFDLGSGSGRLSYPFSQLISDTGHYYGADVWQEGVEMCNARFTQPNMSFHLIPAKNNYYFEKFNPNVANNFKLDFLPDSSVHLVFAISVFTHLIEEDARAYLHEFKRILRPDGYAYITCFIIDKFFKDYVSTYQEYGTVKEVSPGHYQAYEGQDFFGGYTRHKIEEMVRDAGLEIVTLERGQWVRKPGANTYQDLIIVGHYRGIDEI